MYNADERNFTVTRINFEGFSAKPEKIQWIHNGTMVITIEEKPAIDDGESDDTNEDDGNNQFNPKKWMSGISGDTPLNYINIPGTHDSFAYSFPYALDIAKAWAKTQKINIRDQLNIGCRFLDIRINQDLEGRHSSIDCSDDLWKAMEWIKSFLKENPKETILMRIQLEDENNLSILNYNLDIIIKAYGELFWKSNGKTEWPKLNDVRGKIVVLDSLSGDFFYNRGYGFKYESTEEHKYMEIQDEYDCFTIGGKWDEIEKNLKIPYDHSKLKINYVSASSINTPADFARDLNKRVMDYVSNNKNCYTGVIVFDFVDDNITKPIFLNQQLQ
jgi:1-phosphatidylinositol phosphodiesterase